MKRTLYILSIIVILINISSKINDNVTELLEKILGFVQRRKQQLSENITNVNTPGYIPKDLDVKGFAYLMTCAVAEHMQSERLLLCDNEYIKFGPDGVFESLPMVDHHAYELLCSDSKAYLENQLKKLSENRANYKAAQEILRHKRSMAMMRGN